MSRVNCIFSDGAPAGQHVCSNVAAVTKLGIPPGPTPSAGLCAKACISRQPIDVSKPALVQIGFAGVRWPQRPGRAMLQDRKLPLSHKIPQSRPSAPPEMPGRAQWLEFHVWGLNADANPSEWPDDKIENFLNDFGNRLKFGCACKADYRRMVSGRAKPKGGECWHYTYLIHAEVNRKPDLNKPTPPEPEAKAFWMAERDRISAEKGRSIEWWGEEIKRRAAASAASAPANPDGASS